jgi:prevent-host-death family protein
MQTIGAFEAKTHFSALLEQVERGEQVTITKHGRPVAKLVPTTVVDNVRIRQAIQQLKEFSRTNTLDGLDWKILRDEGRR